MNESREPNEPIIDLTRRVHLEVNWEDPPPPKAYRSPSHLRSDVLEQFKSALIAHPECWAVMPLDGLNPQRESTLRTHAASINQRRSAWRGTHVWEALYRNDKVYVRYMGEDEG